MNSAALGALVIWDVVWVLIAIASGWPRGGMAVVELAALGDPELKRVGGSIAGELVGVSS